MKKSAKIIALTVFAAGAFTLSACGGCSGCGGTTTYKITTAPNWQIRGSSADDLETSSVLFDAKETAVYTVDFSKGANTNYSLEYTQGQYTTTFYAIQYDWNDSSIPQELKAEGETDPVYVYETSLTLTGKFVVGSDEHEFTNVIETVSYFRSAANNLSPVYSMQDIQCTSPNSLQPASIETAYVEMDRVYETYYSRDGGTAVTTVTARGNDDIQSGTTTAGTGTEYTLFDSSSLGVALRGMSQSSTQLFDVFVPVNGANARYQAAWGSSATVASDNDAYTGIIAAMNSAADDGYILNGRDEEGARQFSWTPVTVSLVSSMAGPSNTYYYASVTNADLNTQRAVLMRVEEVVPFNLGTIVYNLQSVELN